MLKLLNTSRFTRPERMTNKSMNRRTKRKAKEDHHKGNDMTLFSVTVWCNRLYFLNSHELKH